MAELVGETGKLQRGLVQISDFLRELILHFIRHDDVDFFTGALRQYVELLDYDLFKRWQKGLADFKNFRAI